MPLYPLAFEPILKQKVWGGRRLERLGKHLPPGAAVGESWELADLDSTSASGGGGEAARSVVAHGPLAGRTLREVLESRGPEAMGDAALSPGGAFPLLVKFLDARENLSVQTHPSPAYAAANPDAHLKTECWFVLDAEPGAVIYKGLKPGLSAADLRRRLADGSVPEALRPVSVNPGDCHLLPSGTVHALGAGVLVAEVQTPSDTTFRLFDWGRAGREMHIEQAMRCIDFSAAIPAWGVRFDALGRRRIVSTPQFAIDQINVAARESMAVATSATPLVWICVAGGGAIAASSRQFDPIRIGAGSTLLLPAALAPSTFTADASGATILETRLSIPGH